MLQAAVVIRLGDSIVEKMGDVYSDVMTWLYGGCLACGDVDGDLLTFKTCLSYYNQIPCAESN